MNDRFVELLGYSKKELTNLKFRDITHPDDVEENINYYDKLKTGALKYYKIKKDISLRMETLFGFLLVRVL